MNVGTNISLSGDGDILAVQSLFFNPDGSWLGQVRVHAWDGNAWVQKGANFESTAPFSLSSNGSTLAIGKQVFDWDGDSWVQRGQDIDFQAVNYGYRLSLSDDGSILAIGDPGFDNCEYPGINCAYGVGRVRVIAWDGNTWVQRGLDIVGETQSDGLGHSVSLSHDGSVLAIGIKYHGLYGGPNSNTGQVRVFDWDGGTWVQKGSNIDGGSSGDQFGHSVSLSQDGDIVAIGSDSFTTNPDYAQVLAWEGNTWIQRGSDMIHGTNVSLSGDGSIVAVSEISNYGSGEDGTLFYKTTSVYDFSCVAVEGCTNLLATTDPTANVDDGSCIIPGCPFEVACNYNPEATTDDGSCIFICPGCTDPLATTTTGPFKKMALASPFRHLRSKQRRLLGRVSDDEDGDGVCLEDEVWMHRPRGMQLQQLTEEDDSCEFLSCAGCTDEGACNFDPDATIEDSSGCEYETCEGCTYEFACNHDPDATIPDNDTCEFALSRLH